MLPTARTSWTAALLGAALLAAATLLPTGVAWAQEPIDPPEAAEVLPADPCLEVDDLVEDAEARAAVVPQGADELDDVGEEADEVDNPSEDELADDLAAEDEDDGDCAGDDDEEDEDVAPAASGSSLSHARRTGRLSTGSVKLPRGGTVTQVVTMRSAGRTLVVARSKHRAGAGRTLRIKAKLTPVGRRALTSATGTVRLAVRTTVVPRVGAKRIIIRTVTLGGVS